MLAQLSTCSNETLIVDERSQSRSSRAGVESGDIDRQAAVTFLAGFGKRLSSDKLFDNFVDQGHVLANANRT